MIAYHERLDMAFPELPLWFRYVLLGISCGIGVFVVAGVLAGQIALSWVIFLVVFLVLTAYISTRKINVFGTSMRIGDLLSFFTLAATHPEPGAPEVRQRLSNCEARIMESKERRP